MSVGVSNARAYLASMGYQLLATDGGAPFRIWSLNYKIDVIENLSEDDLDQIVNGTKYNDILSRFAG